MRHFYGTAPSQKAPALTDDIRAMVDATDDSTIGIRDRALILLGFAGKLAPVENRSAWALAGRLESLMDRIRRHARSEQCKRGFEQAAISTGSLFPSINRHGQVQEPGRLSGIDVARIVKSWRRAQASMPPNMLGTRLGPPRDQRGNRERVGNVWDHSCLSMLRDRHFLGHEVKPVSRIRVRDRLLAAIRDTVIGPCCLKPVQLSLRCHFPMNTAR